MLPDHSVTYVPGSDRGCRLPFGRRPENRKQVLVYLVNDYLMKCTVIDHEMAA